MDLTCIVLAGLLPVLLAISPSLEMALVLDKISLADVAQVVPFPAIVQQFVNHGGHVFKVYVAGNEVFYSVRPSIPDITPSLREAHPRVFAFDSLKSLPTKALPAKGSTPGNAVAPAAASHSPPSPPPGPPDVDSEAKGSTSGSAAAPAAASHPAPEPPAVDSAAPGNAAAPAAALHPAPEPPAVDSAAPGDAAAPAAALHPAPEPPAVDSAAPGDAAAPAAALHPPSAPPPAPYLVDSAAPRNAASPPAALHHTPEPPADFAVLDSAVLKVIAQYLRERFGLSLFGFDIVVSENEDGGMKYNVIDVNYFPSYKDATNAGLIFRRAVKASVLEHKLCCKQ
eukprot:gene2436-8760_t